MLVVESGLRDKPCGLFCCTFQSVRLATLDGTANTSK